MSADRSSAREETDTSDGGTEGGTSAEEAGSDGPGASGGERGERSERMGGREVIVSRELYKVITVFSTLIAIGAVVGGFILLDTATNRTVAAASEVNLPLAIGGIGSIALGAAVYAFASRFRTRGMGSPNSDADGESGNG